MGGFLFLWPSLGTSIPAFAYLCNSMILLLAIEALKIQKKFRKVSDKHFYLEKQGYTYNENRLGDEMERSRKPKKRKFGTTVLEQTDDNISMFKEQHPQEFKTPGEVVDLLASLCLRVNKGAAAELSAFCAQRVKSIQDELSGYGDAESLSLAADDLNDKLSYYKALRNHMLRFVPQDSLVDKGPSMKRVDLRGGSYLVVPDDWPVVNESNAASCDYAFVLEVRNASDAIPHYVYLSSREACPTDEVLNAIADKWPGIRDVQSSQVEPIYDKDGAILNTDEWTKAPIIGVFPIRDASSFSWEDKAPYGAMVYRH